MSGLGISTPHLSGSIIGSAQFGKAWREAPKRLVKGIRDGVARGLLGFRKEWLQKTEIEALRKPRNRWIWVVRTSDSGTIDTISGRLFPRKFHRSLGRFERGGTYTPRKSRFFAIAFRWNRKVSGKPKAGYYSPTWFLRRFPSRKLVPMKSKSGRLILVEFRKSRGKWKLFKPAFLLLPRIQTPHRLRLKATWESPAARNNFLRRLNENVDKTLRKIFGRPTR